LYKTDAAHKVPAGKTVMRGIGKTVGESLLGHSSVT